MALVSSQTEFSNEDSHQGNNLRTWASLSSLIGIPMVLVCFPMANDQAQRGTEIDDDYWKIRTSS